MSEIKVDTLTGKTTANDITVTVGATATMSLRIGLMTGFAYFDNNGEFSTRSSLNISSLTDSGTGIVGHNWASAYSNVNQPHSGMATRSAVHGLNGGGDAFLTSTTTSTSTTTDNGTDNRADSEGSLVVHGDLA